MILGISDGIHNTSACLLQEGKVIAAIEEERISRYKRDGRPPMGAVNTLLEEHDPDTISHIAVSGTVNWSVRRRAKSALRSSSDYAEENVKRSNRSNDPFYLQFADVVVSTLSNHWIPTL